MKRYIFLAAAAALCLWQCTVAEVQPLQYAAPEAEFPTDVPDAISLSVGDTCTFSVNFTSGEKLTKEWKVNDRLESSSDKLTYIFNEPGTFIVSFKAYNGSGSVEKSYTVTVDDDFEMHLSVGDSTEVTRYEDSPLRLYAIVDKGQNVKHSWKVDGVELSTDEYFNAYYFPKNPNEIPTEHTVSYTGSNAKGTFSRKFKVKVANRPLTVELLEQHKRAFTYTVNITANPIYSTTGVTHKWYFGDELVSETDKITYLLPSFGTYYVKYHAENAKGETLEKEWTIVYDEYLADFNDGEFSDMFKIHNSNKNFLKKEKLTIVDSPYDGDKQGKVLCWFNNTNNKDILTRGGIIMLNDYFKKNGIDLKQFKGIKFRGRLFSDKLSDTGRRSPCVAYLPENEYSGEYKDNYPKNSIRLGEGDSGFPDIEKYGNWDYIYKSAWTQLTYSVDFSQEGTLKIYPTCTVNTTEPVRGYFAKVYIDDVVLF